MNNNRVLNWVTSRKIEIKGFFLYLMGSFITMILSLIINPLISKTMSHSDFAIIGYFTSFSALITPLISFSFVSYYSRHFYLLNDKEREDTKNTLLIAMLFLSLMLSVIITIFFVFYAKLVKLSLPVLPYAFLQIFSIYLSNFFVFMQVDLKMKRNPLKYFRITVLFGIINFLFILFLVVILKYGATGKLLATFMAYLVLSIYCFKYFFTGWTFNKVILRKAIRFSSPLIFAGMFAYFYSGIDMFFLEKRNDTYNMAYYSIALMISNYIMIFGTAFGQTIQADFFEALAHENWNKIIKLTFFTLIINAIPVFIFIIFAPFIISILTAGKYNGATQYAQLLCFRVIPFFLYFCFENIIIGLGYSKGLLIIKLTGLVLIVGIYYVLIEQYAFFGAAWGQVLSYLVLTIISVFYLIFKKDLMRRYIWLKK